MLHSLDINQYYFSKLTKEQKTIYKAIQAGLKSLSNIISLPMLPANEISMVFSAVLLDNPLFFYVSAFDYRSDLYKRKIALKPKYKHEKDFIRQSTTSVYQHLQVFNQVNNSSDYEKTLFIHDYCLRNFRYDYTFADQSFSILGPILNKQAVCEGISHYVKLSLEYVGIRCLVVIGKGMSPAHSSIHSEAHAWNIVSIDGANHHLDVTFNMTLKDRIYRYDYFNISDSDILKDHAFSNDLPKCSTTGNDYYSRNSLLAYNSQELEKKIDNMLRSGNKQFQIKLINVKVKEEIVNRVSSIALKKYSEIYRTNTSFNLSYNESQMIFEFSFI